MMKRFISRRHAANLKRIYMKTDFDHQLVMGIHNRKAAMYDILAEREQLPGEYDRHRHCASPCYCGINACSR